ncbi:hypothetical protein, partial [Burkholderia pseudomallei]
PFLRWKPFSQVSTGPKIPGQVKPVGAFLEPHLSKQAAHVLVPRVHEVDQRDIFSKHAIEAKIGETRFKPQHIKEAQRKAIELHGGHPLFPDVVDFALCRKLSRNNFAARRVTKGR